MNENRASLRNNMIYNRTVDYFNRMNKLKNSGRKNESYGKEDI